MVHYQLCREDARGQAPATVRVFAVDLLDVAMLQLAGGTPARTLRSAHGARRMHNAPADAGRHQSPRTDARVGVHLFGCLSRTPLDRKFAYGCTVPVDRDRSWGKSNGIVDGPNETPTIRGQLCFSSLLCYTVWSVSKRARIYSPSTRPELQRKV